MRFFAILFTCTYKYNSAILSIGISVASIANKLLLVPLFSNNIFLQ
ncbi:hypothetical protein [Spiroplasma endosymbiont of Asaphidion curtum]